MVNMETLPDTSTEYDDLVGYVADENVPNDLSTFIGDKTNNEPKVKQKAVDPDFPEEWQNLYVNFDCLEDYAEFMNKIGEVPVPKLRSLVYQQEKDNGILDFFGD